MRKLTDEDLDRIIGSTITGYYVEAAKIKQGPFTDSDHYGFLLGRNPAGEYATWQFHLLNNDSVSYWGHFISGREEALRDFNARSMDEVPQWFDVTITETLELTVRVEARSKQEAEQIVSNDWKRQEYVLGPECFSGVEFEVVPAVEGQSKSSLGDEHNRSKDKMQEFINTYVTLRQDAFHNDSDIIDGLLQVFSREELEQYGFGGFICSYIGDNKP